MSVIPDRRSIRGDAFWGTVERSAHILQVYRTETIFLDALEGFIGSGLRGEEAAVVIASAPHLHELEKRLRQRWIDVDRARWQQRYIPILASETLQKVLVDGMLDEGQFVEVAGKLISRARGNGRPVRAFVEMVPLLWAEGKTDASAQLETFWAKLAKAEEFPLFCAYSQDNYERHAAAPCAEHSLLLPG
jgi:DcmR-like sensory protein